MDNVVDMNNDVFVIERNVAEQLFMDALGRLKSATDSEACKKIMEFRENNGDAFYNYEMAGILYCVMLGLSAEWMFGEYQDTKAFMNILSSKAQSIMNNSVWTIPRQQNRNDS